MSVSKLSFLVLSACYLFENQVQPARADSTAPVVAGPAVAFGAAVPTGISTTGAQPHQNSLRADREAIHDDRRNGRTDRIEIEKDRRDIGAAEHDIQINPQNKSADQARIAADQKSLKSDRQDLVKNEHRLHHDQQSLRSAWNQQRYQHQGMGGVSKPLYSNGFFPPTNRPNQNGSGGFGGEPLHEREREHRAVEHRVR